jgi:hypothetical protein
MRETEACPTRNTTSVQQGTISLNIHYRVCHLYTSLTLDERMHSLTMLGCDEHDCDGHLG